jgi:hypothetical protein
MIAFKLLFLTALSLYRNELVNIIDRANDQNVSNETLKVLINNSKENIPKVAGKYLLHDENNYIRHVDPLLIEVDKTVHNNVDVITIEGNTLYIESLKTEMGILQECQKRIESETSYHENLIDNFNKYNAPRLELFKAVKSNFQELILAYGSIINSKEANNYTSINSSSPEALELARKSNNFRTSLAEYRTYRQRPVQLIN